MDVGFLRFVAMSVLAVSRAGLPCDITPDRPYQVLARVIVSKHLTSSLRYVAATTNPSPHRIIAFPLRKHFRADRFHDFRVSLADELFRTPQQDRDRAARLMLIR